MIRQLSSRRVYESPYLRLREDAIEQPDGSRGIYGVVEKPDFALVVPWDGERAAPRRPVPLPGRLVRMGVPQGGVEGFVPEQPSEIAAASWRRRPGCARIACSTSAACGTRTGFSQQGFDAFLATGLAAGVTRRESSEQTMESRTVGIDELEAMILSGELRDAPSVAALGSRPHASVL